jgi:predicted Zn-dependent peptidase
MAWISPPAYAKGDAELDLLSEVLTEGKASRLYKALVYDQQLAQTVTAHQASKRLVSDFNIEAIARPGVSLDAIQKAIDDELAKVRATAVSAEELSRAKNQYEAGFVMRMQSLETRASLLNGYYASHKDPGYASKDLKRYLDVGADDLLAVARDVLDPERRVILSIVPRDKPPAEGEKPAGGAR